MEFFQQNWLIVLVVLIIVLIVAILVLRPRQRIQLTDSSPIRPHMAKPIRPNEGRAVAGEAAAATSDVAGEVIGAPVHRHLSGGGGAPDDLQRLKGVGPKFAQLLQAQGVTRYEQLARLTSAEVERLDSVLGPFRGRLTRDRVIEQADYLARGDEDGFEDRFGKL
jgi:predicted flap endonuclease-1-like 5' DNA nuclease